MGGIVSAVGILFQHRGSQCCGYGFSMGGSQCCGYGGVVSAVGILFQHGGYSPCCGDIVSYTVTIYATHENPRAYQLTEGRKMNRMGSPKLRHMRVHFL